MGGAGSFPYRLAPRPVLSELVPSSVEGVEGFMLGVIFISGEAGHGDALCHSALDAESKNT
jgi:hypothetical protein